MFGTWLIMGETIPLIISYVNGQAIENQNTHIATPVPDSFKTYIEGEFAFYDPGQSYFENLLFEVPYEHKSRFEQILSGSEIINVYLTKSLCLLVTRFISYDRETGYLITSKPIKIKFHERRSQVRLKVSSPMNILYNCDDRDVINKLVYDISEGGFSIVFSNPEVLRLDSGALLRKAFFSYDKNVQYIDCKLLAKLKIKPFELDDLPYAASRVSFQFENLTNDQRLFIQKVLDHEKVHSKVS